MAVNCHKICYLDGEQFRKALTRGNIAKMNKKSEIVQVKHLLFKDI